MPEENEDRDHEHTEECGHTKEEHEKLARVQSKFDAFLEDAAEDMFDDKDLANLLTIVKGRLKKCKAGTSITYLRAFTAGFEFGTYAASKNDHSMQLIAGMKRINKLKDDEIRTIISKSLEDNDN